MPQEHVFTSYLFDELSEEAKEKAINETRNGEYYLHYGWYDGVYEDFANICKLIGIELGTKHSGNGLAIYFSGFWSQGDGACFEGSYSYKKGCLKLVKEYAPKDTELHSIVKELVKVQKNNFYKLTANMHHRGHYYHSGCMVVDVSDDRDPYGNLYNELAEDHVASCMRGLADWLYGKLEKEHDYLNSDEVVRDGIVANEDRFNEDGSVWRS